MEYKIVAEGHEGSFSCREEVLGVSEADSPDDALVEYSSRDQRVHYVESWKRYVIGDSRKVFARESNDV